MRNAPICTLSVSLIEDDKSSGRRVGDTPQFGDLA